MESLRIKIVNPKGRRLLYSLAEMDLIRIKKEKTKSDFMEFLASLRKNSEEAPSQEEISKELESIRKLRYEK